MANLTFAGPYLYRLRSLAKISQIAIATSLRHAFGRRMAPDWDAQMETGIRFIRHQFTQAMAQADMARGRLLFDSLQPETEDVYGVQAHPAGDFEATWYTPAEQTRDVVLLYFHGGGYAFHGGVSVRFAQMLAHRTGVRVFAPDYRLTPEHPHPAQAEDAMAAWAYLTADVPAERVVVIGDSAGGHMALMLLQALKTAGDKQPALCVGLCPWADIGNRGESLTENDQYDLVQGWMALQFGRWLDPDGTFGREALSPIAYDYAGLAPMYLQTGGREVLRDMILAFAKRQAALGAEVTLDLWEDMPHNFQAYDSLKPSSSQALQRLNAAIDAYGEGPGVPEPLSGVTVVTRQSPLSFPRDDGGHGPG